LPARQWKSETGLRDLLIGYWRASPKREAGGASPRLIGESPKALEGTWRLAAQQTMGGVRLYILDVSSEATGAAYLT
jgi:hypothetical protein